MATDKSAGKARVDNSWLAALLKRDDLTFALAYMAGALRGLAEIQKPAKFQRQIALDTADQVSAWLEAREASREASQ